MLKELTIQEFDQFVKNHPLANHYQTINYALLMVENGFKYQLLGLVNDQSKICAAGLIIIKKMNLLFKYGYAPCGFILDYTNNCLLKEFTEEIINYYKKRNLLFIKINPEIAIGEVNKNGTKKYNNNVKINEELIKLGYKKLKDNLYFESKIPKYNGVVNLKDLSFDKNTRNKIKKGQYKGLKLEISDRSGIDVLYSFIKRKKEKSANYYKDYYNAFKKTNAIDLFLVSIDAPTYLENARSLYSEEMKKNEMLTRKYEQNKQEKNRKQKENSDQRLQIYKKDILEAEELTKKKEKVYVAGALVVKHKNRVNIIISGFDKNYKPWQPNYFLHSEIINYYKENYKFLDLNGMTGDFSKENPYKGLNDFKFSFHPKVYEFIGEYDLVIYPKVYDYLLRSGKLAAVFNKTNLKQK